MNILALDTTMRACSAALLRDAQGTGDLFAAFEHLERGHAEAIMPMIEKIMARAELCWDALDRIAVTTGPGTFTGVRVGVAAARGLALATGAGLIGITSLAAIAAAVLDQRETEGNGGIVAVAADARRGQVYFALFDAAGSALCDPMAATAGEAAGLLPEGQDLVLAGSGARLVAEEAEKRDIKACAVLPDMQPDAATVVRMAAGQTVEPGPVSPLYLRAPDAKPQTGKTIAHL